MKQTDETKKRKHYEKSALPDGLRGEQDVQPSAAGFLISKGYCWNFIEPDTQ